MTKMAESDAEDRDTGLGGRMAGRLGGVASASLSILATFFGLFVITFFIGRVLPIDPVLAIIGEEADAETYARVARELGLDRPLVEQFFVYLGNVLQGDFGNARLTGNPVWSDIARAFPATIELSTFAIIIGTAIGIPLGVLSATNRGNVIDHIARFVMLLGYSTPVFWFGLIGLVVFYAWLGWVGGSGQLSLHYLDMVPRVTGFNTIDAALAGEWRIFGNALNHLILPASILGYASVAFIGRMTRSFMIEQLPQEYVIAARVKGLSQNAVVWRHAFRNIRVQLLTIVALAYGGLLEGTVLIESVFAWPGLGQYFTNALLVGDMNAVMASTLLIGVIFVGLNGLSDIFYRIFDPRTK